MNEDDPRWLRREGERLIAKGQAMLDRADNLEADGALGGDARKTHLPGVGNGLAGLAREMCTFGWVTAGALSERSGQGVRECGSVLSRLVSRGELVTRRLPGYPSEYSISDGFGHRTKS